MVEILVFASADGFGATVVTGVIGVLILVLAEGCGTTVVAVMILISVLASAVGLTATVVASVVLVAILAGADGFGATIVTCVVLVGISVSADGNRATVVTGVILIVISVSTEVPVTTIVALVILVGVYASTDGFFAAIITDMILVGVFMSAVDLITTVVAIVVVIGIFTNAHLCVTFIAVVVGICILAFGQLFFALTVITDVVTVAFAVCVSADLLGATVVTGVVGVFVLVLAEGCGTTVVAGVIEVGVFAIFKNRAAAVITDVIIVFGGIGVSADRFGATIVTGVVSVAIYVFTISLITAVVAIVIIVGIFASANGFGAAVVTDVILVAVCVGVVTAVVCGTRAVGITDVILASIAAGGYACLATVVTSMITVIVCVGTGAHNIATGITHVILGGFVRVSIECGLVTAVAFMPVVSTIGRPFGAVAVSRSFNDFLCFQNFIADGAFRSLGKTGFSTGRIDRRDGLPGMSRSIHYKRCFNSCGCSCFIQEENATILSAALVMFLLSLFGTSGSDSLNLFGIMAEGSNAFCVGMRRIILTGKGLYAICCTGGIGGNYTVIISMADGSNSLSRNGGCIFAGLILEYAAASAAGVVCIVAGCCAGCSLRFCQGHVVTQGFDLVISGVVTLSAILVRIPADFGTGCCLGGYCCNIVTGCLNGLLRNGGYCCAGFILEYASTSGAGVVCVVAGLCTGCCLSFGLGHLVAKGSLFNVRCVVASRTSYVCIPSDLSTGRCLCFVSNFIVTKGIDCFLFNQNYVTDRAVLACGQAGCGTGRSNRCVNHFGMALGRNNLSHSLLCCPGYNKGCGEGLQTRFCAGSFRCYFGGYSCCRSLNMPAVIGAHTLSGAVSIAICPFIGRLAICVTQCSNVFYILSLLGCPSDIKGCGVGCPALCCTSGISCYLAVYSCCCSLNMAVVSGAHMLSGADPGAVRSVISPLISCIFKAMTKSLAYRNGRVGAYRITTVALYIVSCGICTGSRRCFFPGILFIETVAQLGAFFYKRLGRMNVAAVCTLCIVYSIFCTSSLFSHRIRKQRITMTRSSHFVGYIGVTTFAGVCGVAAIGTSGSGYNGGVLVFMRLRCNFDFSSNVFNVDIDYFTTKLFVGIVCQGNAALGNVYAIHENFHLHNQALIVQLQACVEALTH